MHSRASRTLRRVQSSLFASQTSSSALVLAVLSYTDLRLDFKKDQNATCPRRCSSLHEEWALVRPGRLTIPTLCNIHTSSGLFRSTRTNLFIPPQLARLLMAASFAVAQAVIVAYRKEKQNMEREEGKEGEASKDASGGSHPHVSNRNHVPISSLEALQILGLEELRPHLINLSSSSSSSSESNAGLPLVAPHERELAQKNFEKMFEIAKKHENWFLAGKLSAAYRKCVDPTWDHFKDRDKEEPRDDDFKKYTRDNGL